jgi:hypothetical protein
MEHALRTAHRLMGLATVALFLLSGLVLVHHHVSGMPVDSGLRLLFRSRHIYLLFSGLINLAVGLGFVLPSRGRGSVTARIGSFSILAAPVLLTVAFYLEPMTSGRFGPVSGLGVLAAFLGVMAYSLGTWRRPVV